MEIMNRLPPLNMSKVAPIASDSLDDDTASRLKLSLNELHMQFGVISKQLEFVEQELADQRRIIDKNKQALTKLIGM